MSPGTTTSAGGTAILARADLLLAHGLRSASSPRRADAPPTVTRCPYKGTARYWSAGSDDVAWSYSNPIPECPRIAGLVAFFNERTDLILDGERQERPQTPWSRR